MSLATLGVGVVLAAGIGGWRKMEARLDESRAENARTRVQGKLMARAREMGAKSLPSELFLRAFKLDDEIEVWARWSPKSAYRLWGTYRVAAQSGGVGPKRKQGDRQVPEGFYLIEGLNPKSRFHLSLRVNYPNASDRVRSDAKHPGNDIYVHGSQVSIGCLAMTDPVIEELFTLVADRWPRRIEIHIFPTRLTEARERELARVHPEHAAFWAEIAPGFRQFEKTRRPFKVTVDAKGRYSIGSSSE